jgi:SAM-dependent methyltransferase
MSGATRSWNREFNWISSVTGDPRALAELDEAMRAFYSQQASRHRYQKMIDADESAQPQTETAMRRAVLARNPFSILEVGCGSGRIYKRLRLEGFQGTYTGLEMSLEVVAQNRTMFPEAVWICGSIYETPVPGGGFDAVYAYFVIEHCVYPCRALARMIDLLHPGGALTLVFPDCVRMGRMGSQALGRVPGRAYERLRQGDVLNAAFNLYESRWRLPKALRQLVTHWGQFPVNLSPRCLVDPGCIQPDVDQVYISSKQEIHEWAEEKGLRVQYPAGMRGNFKENALMQLVLSP